MLEIQKKMMKHYFISRGMQTIPKGAYCLNHIKIKTTIFTGTRDAITK